MAGQSGHFHTIRIHEAVFKTLPFITRAAVRTAGGDDWGIGSLVTSSTDGRMYLKIADNAADADWQKVTVSNAD